MPVITTTSRLVTLVMSLALVAAPVCPFTVTPALANYSCEPGQPNCVPMDQLNTHADTPWPEISCRVKGPRTIPSNDIVFTNVGDVAIKAGTRIRWLFKQTGESGWFVLGYDLPVGADVPDFDVIETPMGGGTPCLSRLA